jgi:type I restriction enzyme M protein
MKYDIVVANPPFSLDKWGAETASGDQYNRFHRGVPPKSKGDYAFITHMIETTYEDTGKVGVIVPHGVLFRGSSEGKIRESLIQENLLEAVIGLPSNLFFGTGIPAAILIFNKGKGENKDVLFIDASPNYEAGKNQNRLRTEDIQQIIETYQSFKNTAPVKDDEGIVLKDRYAYRASLKEIEENGFNLNIPRYVDMFVEEDVIDIVATQVEIARLKNDLLSVEQQMEVYLKELGF